MNCLKQGLHDRTRSLPENELCGLPASTRYDFDRVKQYPLKAGSAAGTCQPSLDCNSTLWTPRQRTQPIHHIPADISMDSFPNSPPTLLHDWVIQTPHGVDQAKPTQLQVAHDCMAEILVQILKFLNILTTNQALSESLRTQVSGFFGKNSQILHPVI